MNAFTELGSTQGQIAMTLLVWEKGPALSVWHEASIDHKSTRISRKRLSALELVCLGGDPDALLPLAGAHPAALNTNLGQWCGRLCHSTH